MCPLSTNERVKKDFQWIAEHPEINQQYAGEYIAVVSEKIVAHDKDFFRMIEKATTVDSQPLVYQVPLIEELIASTTPLLNSGACVD